MFKTWYIFTNPLVPPSTLFSHLEHFCTPSPHMISPLPPPPPPKLYDKHPHKIICTVRVLVGTCTIGVSDQLFSAPPSWNPVYILSKILFVKYFYKGWLTYTPKHLASCERSWRRPTSTISAGGYLEDLILLFIKGQLNQFKRLLSKFEITKMNFDPIAAVIKHKAMITSICIFRILNLQF